MDFFIFHQINQFAFQWLWLDTLAIFFAQYFGYFLIAFLLLFLLKNFKKYWSMVIQALLAAIFARLIIVEIIRYFLPKSRPFVENSVNLLLNHSREPSFPSGHAAFYFALSMVVFLYLKKVHPPLKFWWGAGFLFIAASFLISVSRVFAGLHWPFDIVTGAFIGILSGIFILFSLQKFSSIVKRQSPQ